MSLWIVEYPLYFNIFVFRNDMLPVRVYNFLILLSFSAFCLISVSCKKTRGCIDPYADNFNPAAEVDDNSCIPPRNKFFGVYSAEYACKNPVGNPELVTIKADNVTLTDIVIDKLIGHGAPVKATVNKAQFVIPFKDFQGNSGLYVRGKGSVVGKTVTIEYEIGPYAAPDIVNNKCILTLTR